MNHVPRKKPKPSSSMSSGLGISQVGGGAGTTGVISAAGIILLQRCLTYRLPVTVIVSTAGWRTWRDKRHGVVDDSSTDMRHGGGGLADREGKVDPRRVDAR